MLPPPPPSIRRRKRDLSRKRGEGEKKIDDKNRHKPYGLTAWAPVDDVYMVRYYPKPVHEASVAIEMMKNFQKLDFSSENQPVYVNFMRLDMKLEKKEKVDPFVSTINLPHPFKLDINKIVVFTENPDQARIAMENGAAVAGGAELVEKILADEIIADFYLAEPGIVQKLHPLKNKLRKKFPKSKRGSVGVNIPKMLEMFKSGHEYLVEDIYVNTQVATLDMPKEHILENIHAIVKDVASHKPAEFGPFIERAIVCSRSSEALHIKFEELLQQEEKKA
ncbi:LOW QUALITY PROTEIN: 39S ribosomal protein L1, mitochondrial-like [Puntigrus tetrazona]|uniref:LOW QUALITY PROTEIN: 39S ribosomal protein L1, mitochondrial-like n=1 Tax=Puntigrus tetrazona TaxID=1606681 RepID=UPI001C89B1F2|nr:LOW QUALITY PROTEIN: 39S ribosomal protein L1, mitochondrial-like [Puntigrus tetrazona]